VLNRGNRRAEVFHEHDDYAAFLELLGLATARLPVRLVGYCLMPNHFHLVAWPTEDGQLGRWMHWLMTAQVRRYRKRHGTAGHVWQGRYKAFPIQEDDHLITVLRYVERNALRAGLVGSAEDWPYSSLHGGAGSPPLDPGPVPRRRRWREFVNRPMIEAESEAVRLSITRDRPFGSERWVDSTADRLGLRYTLRNPGRPRKPQPEGAT
jgi:putative transposase